MWRSLIRIAPLAIAGFQWWRRRQQRKAPRPTQPSQAPRAQDDRLP